MYLAVLLLHCTDTDEQRKATGATFTRFTRNWAEGAIGRVADYFFAQSGGRESVSFKVFDWLSLSKTETEWMALGFGAFDSLRKEIEDNIDESLDEFTHILIGIDHSQSSGGTTSGASTHTVTYLAASNFTPSLIAHELGHRYGAPDAFRETATGENIYENRFCVMGASGWPAVFADGEIADPTAQMLNQSGPGMSAPTLMAAGWLKEDAHGASVELSENNLVSGGGAVLQLSALTGAPGPTWRRPPVVIRFQDLVIEYRVRVSNGWDRGLPDPGDGSGGWVVVHRSDRRTPRALYVDSLSASPGATLALGEDDPLDLFNPGPVRISILSFDSSARSVRLGIARRAARPLPEGTTYGGVDVGGGGLVWTPGRGFTRVPPRSPLITVLDKIAQIQAIQEMMVLASGDEMKGLSREASTVLESLTQSVGDLHIAPSLSPLAQALNNVSTLLNASEELELSTEDRRETQRFIEASRQQLIDVKQILSKVVEGERHR